jgi:hypothetical protein
MSPAISSMVLMPMKSLATESGVEGSEIKTHNNNGRMFLTIELLDVSFNLKMHDK